MAQPFVRLASGARQSLGGIVAVSWQAERGSRWVAVVSGSALGLDEAGKEFAFGALHGLGGSQIGL
jgi:hypothetical protein